MNISIDKFCSMVSNSNNETCFDLPTIQRGFVWKPYQIEDLWDSLARNFPIGTFTVDDSSNDIQILDGQQRASAIAIGYKGKDSKDLFNLKGNFMRLFVDIAKPSQETDKKFTFKLITRSHPWGYQLKDNEKTLSVADRRKALDVFDARGIITEKEKYYKVKDEDKDNFFPYDCYLPVPVELFFQEDTQGVEDWLKNTFKGYIEITNDRVKITPIDFYGLDGNQEKKVPTKGLLAIYEGIYKGYKDKYNSKKRNEEALSQQIQNTFNGLNKSLYESIPAQENSAENPKKLKNEKINFYTINELYEAIQNIKSYQLVFSNLTNSKLKFAENVIENDRERVLAEDEQTENIEIIFQRLNRGGTPISEDDLTYSLFKSSFGKTNEDNKILASFDANCKGLINPSRLFRIAYLLWEQSKKFECNNSKKYELVNQRIDYKLVKNDFSEQKFQEFLEKHFLENSQENYFERFIEAFLYDKSTNINGLPYPLLIQLCKSAPELVFLMLYRLNIMKDYEQVENNSKNKNLMIGFLLGLYWFFKGNNERSYRSLLRTIWPLVSFAEFNACWSTELLQRCNLMYDNYDVIDNYVFDKFDDESLCKYSRASNKEKYLNIFRDKILYKNELVLYAQREYLEKMFQDDDVFSLEDNSVPYDFDHICPSSYRKKAVHRTIKELLDHIGNFRVWPYELNRSDQDNSIPTKFKFDKLTNSFKKYNIFNEKDLKVFSLVEKWNNIVSYGEEILKKENDMIRSLCFDITQRSYYIYLMWYNLIVPIYKNTSKSLFYYNQYKQKDRNKSIVELVNNRVKKFNKNIYISYNEDYVDLIINDSIIVCLCEQEVLSYKDYEHASIEKEFYFTLPSYSKTSFEHLCKEIEQAITEYENKKKLGKK